MTFIETIESPTLFLFVRKINQDIIMKYDYEQKLHVCFFFFIWLQGSLMQVCGFHIMHIMTALAVSWQVDKCQENMLL